MNNDLILDVLSNYPVYYFMFRGGSGGEFLTNLISKHSSKFRNNVSIGIDVTNENRTLVTLPTLFHMISYAKSDSSVKDLIDTIKNKIEFLGYSVTTAVDEAIDYLKKDSKPPLFRCNILSNSYFTKDNTYLLLADTEKWYTYIGILLFLKDLAVKHYCPNDADKIKFFEYDRSRYLNNAELSILLIDGLEWVIKNNISHLYGMQLDAIYYMQYDKTITFEQIFNTAPKDLFDKYFYKVVGDFESYSNDQISLLKERGVTIINYSNIFDKGYLEEIFEIDDREFHVQWINWHEKNLTLMTNHGFDTTSYIL
jgi:hypothetical protein